MNVTQSSSSSVWLVRTVLPRRPFCSGVSMGERERERERERCNRENKRDDVPKYVCVYMSPERKRELYSKQTIPLRHDKLSQAINKLANEIDIRTNIGSHTPTASWRLMRQSSERMGEREREREKTFAIFTSLNTRARDCQDLIWLASRQTIRPVVDGQLDFKWKSGWMRGHIYTRGTIPRSAVKKWKRKERVN